MTSPHETAVDWARRALAEELPGDASVDTRAENLVAIAERYAIPIEALIKWIHLRSPEKGWTAAEWTGWCDKYRAAAHELAQRMLASHELCPRCHAQLVEGSQGRLRCGQCGEVFL